MRKINFLNIINTFLILIIIINIVFVCKNSVEKPNQLIVGRLDSRSIESNYLEIKIDESIEDKEESEIEVSKNTDESIKIKSTDINKENKKTNVENNADKKIEIKSETVQYKADSKVIETITGGLAGYGPDCSGCSSQKTASGYNISNGNINYNDKEYGKVRIVAGDKKYPFGTIVRITNTNYYDTSPIYAIVLDRGGVGIGKKYLFDLLFESEKEASIAGSKKNVTFEILRMGY